MPSTRNEEYRYTDITSLLNSALAVAPADAAVNSEQLQQLAVPEAAGSRVVLVNGTFRPELSDLLAVGEGVYVGGAAGAPADVLQQLVSAFSAVRSSFAALCLRTSVAWHGSRMYHRLSFLETCQQRASPSLQCQSCLRTALYRLGVVQNCLPD
jgi:hypothetical protein